MRHGNCSMNWKKLDKKENADQPYVALSLNAHTKMSTSLKGLVGLVDTHHTTHTQTHAAPL